MVKDSAYADVSSFKELIQNDVLNYELSVPRIKEVTEYFDPTYKEFKDGVVYIQSDTSTGEMGYEFIEGYDITYDLNNTKTGVQQALQIITNPAGVTFAGSVSAPSFTGTLEGSASYAQQAQAMVHKVFTSCGSDLTVKRYLKIGTILLSGGGQTSIGTWKIVDTESAKFFGECNYFVRKNAANTDFEDIKIT